MTHLCWVLAVLVVAVVVVLSDARRHIYKQKERSLVDLDLAEVALRRSKKLLKNCENENDILNSSECSRKNKSLRFIDVALNLVADAKKNFPVCHDEDTTLEHLSEDFLPIDCQEVQGAGGRTSGVYTVWPNPTSQRRVPIQVRCDMDTDGGGWTVIQRRGNFSQQEDFNRDWQHYKNGFGNLDRDFWLGNNNIFALSNQGNYSLRFDMVDDRGRVGYAVFSEFNIDDEDYNYRLQVDKYVDGGAGDGMYFSNGYMFTTKDRDNARYAKGNCADLFKGGFWYWGGEQSGQYCATSNPNGEYAPGGDLLTSMSYASFRDNGLFSMEMKLKRL